MPKILVTGADTLIGREVVRELSEHQHEVSALTTGGCELQDSMAAYSAIASSMPAVVVHAYGCRSRVLCDRMPEQAMVHNTMAAAMVAQACDRLETLMVYVSSCAVYGLVELPAREDLDTDVLPESVLGYTQRNAEDFVRHHCGPNYMIARPSMVYGAGEPADFSGSALAGFLWSAKQKAPIPVHRSARRSWCHARDVAAALRFIIERGDRQTAYNIARNDDERSMSEVAELACEMAGAPLDRCIQLLDRPAQVPEVRRLRTTRLENLGWRATVELGDGMLETLKAMETYDETGRPREMLEAQASC